MADDFNFDAANIGQAVDTIQAAKQDAVLAARSYLDTLQPIAAGLPQTIRNVQHAQEQTRVSDQALLATVDRVAPVVQQANQNLETITRMPRSIANILGIFVSDFDADYQKQKVNSAQSEVQTAANRASFVRNSLANESSLLGTQTEAMVRSQQLQQGIMAAEQTAFDFMLKAVDAKDKMDVRRITRLNDDALTAAAGSDSPLAQIAKEEQTRRKAQSLNLRQLEMAVEKQDAELLAHNRTRYLNGMADEELLGVAKSMRSEDGKLVKGSASLTLPNGKKVDFLAHEIETEMASRKKTMLEAQKAAQERADDMVGRKMEAGKLQGDLTRVIRSIELNRQAGLEVAPEVSLQVNDMMMSIASLAGVTPPDPQKDPQGYREFMAGLPAVAGAIAEKTGSGKQINERVANVLKMVDEADKKALELMPKDQVPAFREYRDTGHVSAHNARLSVAGKQVAGVNNFLEGDPHYELYQQLGGAFQTNLSMGRPMTLDLSDGEKKKNQLAGIPLSTGHAAVAFNSGNLLDAALTSDKAYGVDAKGKPLTFQSAYQGKVLLPEKYEFVARHLAKGNPIFQNIIDPETGRWDASVTNQNGALSIAKLAAKMTAMDEEAKQKGMQSDLVKQFTAAWQNPQMHGAFTNYFTEKYRSQPHREMFALGTGGNMPSLNFALDTLHAHANNFVNSMPALRTQLINPVNDLNPVSGMPSLDQLSAQGQLRRPMSISNVGQNLGAAWDAIKPGTQKAQAQMPIAEPSIQDMFKLFTSNK